MKRFVWGLVLLAIGLNAFVQSVIGIIDEEITTSLFIFVPGGLLSYFGWQFLKRRRATIEMLLQEIKRPEPRINTAAIAQQLKTTEAEVIQIIRTAQIKGTLPLNLTENATSPGFPSATPGGQTPPDCNVNDTANKKEGLLNDEQAAEPNGSSNADQFVYASPEMSRSPAAHGIRCLACGGVDLLDKGKTFSVGNRKYQCLACDFQGWGKPQTVAVVFFWITLICSVLVTMQLIRVAMPAYDLRSHQLVNAGASNFVWILAVPGFYWWILLWGFIRYRQSRLVELASLYQARYPERFTVSSAAAAPYEQCSSQSTLPPLPQRDKTYLGLVQKESMRKSSVFGRVLGWVLVTLGVFFTFPTIGFALFPGDNTLSLGGRLMVVLCFGVPLGVVPIVFGIRFLKKSERFLKNNK